jgi:hypothetical protein
VQIGNYTFLAYFSKTVMQPLVTSCFMSLFQRDLIL